DGHRDPRRGRPVVPRRGRAAADALARAHARRWARVHAAGAVGGGVSRRRHHRGRAGLQHDGRWPSRLARSARGGPLMRAPTTAALLPLVACRLCPAASVAQDARWEAQMTAAKRAGQRQSYGEAEEHLRAALREAERLGPDSAEMFLTVNALGTLLF